MKSHITVYHYDAFSNIPNKFIMKSDMADVKLKYFTPGHEINLCGHATMASLYCLKTRGLLGEIDHIIIETNVGVLAIGFSNENAKLFIEMNQSSPMFQPFTGDVNRLAQTLGISINDIDQSKPIVYGSTGTWTLLIPIIQLDAFKRMIPRNNDFPQVLIDNPRASIHPFSLETKNTETFMHARHFSSPFSGTIEDPVTGTASAVMGAYYLTYLNKEIDHTTFIVEQGQEIGRDGRVIVSAKRTKDKIDVSIRGTAVFVKEMYILLQ